LIKTSVLFSFNTLVIVSRCDASTFYVLRKKYDEELCYSLFLNFFIFIQDIISSSSLNQEVDSYLLWSWYLKKLYRTTIIIIIIINSYIFVTSIKSTHERLYAICIEWTKLSKVENHSQSTWLLHAVETISFETMY